MTSVHFTSRGDRISQQMELGKVISWVTKFVQEKVRFPIGEQIHEFTLGDQVWVEDWKLDLLAPPRKGPCTVIRTTPAALTVAGIAPWIHHTRVKRAYHADPGNAEWTAQRDPADPRETKTTLKKKEKQIPDEPLEDEAAKSTPAAWPHQRAYSYTNFHSTSNCWVCGAMPLSVMDGFPWGLSPLCQGDFKPLCSFLGHNHNLSLLSGYKPDLQSIDSDHRVTFDINARVTKA